MPDSLLTNSKIIAAYREKTKKIIGTRGESARNFSERHHP